MPMNEEPLHLVRRHLRREFEKMLGVHIEGDLCPVCRYRLEVRVQQPLRRISGHRGAASPNATASDWRGAAVSIRITQDTSVLIGSEDISKLEPIFRGRPARARAQRRAQRRQPRKSSSSSKFFKKRDEYLHAMITATQEEK